MATSYKSIAGQSVERLAALSDGIFAVAMTLLVLDPRLPLTQAVHRERDLWHGLVAMTPQLVMYLMSFLTLGIFCVRLNTSPGEKKFRNERRDFTRSAHPSWKRCICKMSG